MATCCHMLAFCIFSFIFILVAFEFFVLDLFLFLPAILSFTREFVSFYPCFCLLAANIIASSIIRHSPCWFSLPTLICHMLHHHFLCFIIVLTYLITHSFATSSYYSHSSPELGQHTTASTHYTNFGIIPFIIHLQSSSFILYQSQ